MSKRLAAFLRFLVSGLLILSILWYFAKNRSLLRMLAEVDLRYCALLLPLVLLLYVISSVNLFVVLKSKHPDLIWRRWVGFHFAKRFLNMHLPQSGNVYEAVKTKERFGIEFLSYAASLGAVNWFNACFNCLAALLLFIVLAISTGSGTMSIMGSLALLLAALALGPLALDYLFSHVRWASCPGILLRFLQGGHQLVQAMRADIFRASVLPQLFGLDLLFVGVSTVTIAVGFKALGVSLGIKALLPFVILNTIVGLVTILPGNVGLIEYAFGLLGSAYDMTMASGIFLSLLLRVASYVVFLIIYLFFLITHKETDVLSPLQ
ncbi:hypothetical protein C4565_05485 [Candidatus Parcubacteria bacterium]|nr:MAG: hypothetical protein C4565_05485 [Candidatus Parcubacteria bacterium]